MLKKIAPAFAALLVAGSLVACGTRTVVVADGQNANVITVNASAEVKVVPDKASFQVEVQAQGETPEEAQASAAEPVNAVLAALREAGVEDKSIQTSYTDLSPLYDWSNGSDTIVGYQMRTVMQVNDVAVDEVSSIMEACVGAGATSVDGLSYSASSYDEAYAQALAEAVTSAKPKADAIAKAAGASLGEVVSVTEGYQDTSYRYKAMASTDEAAGSNAAEMEIAPGEVTITAQVTVVYAIN